MARIGFNISEARDALVRGRLVAIPTETVYGLAANAMNAEAVLSIFEAKSRPAFDPLIVHIGSMSQLDQLVIALPEKARKLAATFWPGPLTLILPKNASVPDIVTSGLPYVGVRMPRHELTLELLRSLAFPLAAPSANPFGYISPTTAEHVADQLGDKVDYILDGGPCEVGLESTIVSFMGDEVQILRLGGLPVSDIEEFIGPVHISTSGSSSNPTAPGMLLSHYAPRKPLFLGDIKSLAKKFEGEKFSVLAFSELRGLPGIVLSTDADMQEAARNLFAVLRQLDADSSSLILAEKVPDLGLGIAINDRLKRASFSYSDEQT
jgi:L-threonylcarbamoyladenylate synthase